MKSLVSCLILAGAASGVSVAGQEPPQPRPFPSLQLYDLRGGSQDLKSMLGRATVVNFWATWCGPCRQELPELQRLYNELAGQGVVVLAVNIDSPRELVKPFFERANLTLPLYFLDEETEATIGIRSLPTTVLLDAQGMVVNIWGGYSRGETEELRRQVEGLLAQARGREGK
jgi:thiol-disulfide isomerase/thioredoxin